MREADPRTGRLRDIVLASVFLVITLPLLIFVSIAIKCDSRGPILVRERRIDRHGRRFYALKFRITGSHGSSDRGVTFVGQIIHFLRIDDLPQLINVLRGEMTCLSADPNDLFFLE